MAQTDIPLVQVDNIAIAELAANHLFEHGFRSFGFCGIRGRPWSEQRREAFERSVKASRCVLQGHQLPSLYSKAWFAEEQRLRLADWIEALPKPIGIMAVNDWAGQKVLEACRTVGVMVPEEVAVVGVDNDSAMCEISDPMLSSIAPRHDRVGYHAAELLDRLMQAKHPPAKPLTVGIPEIVVRRSTDVQTISDRDIVAAVRFIRENACRGIQVGDVAGHVSLSESTLKRRFHGVLSRSIHDEIARVRMDRVRELLTETELTLGQVARAAGFKHQEYLGALFKSKTGMTLGEYRENTKRNMTF